MLLVLFTADLTQKLAHGSLQLSVLTRKSFANRTSNRNIYRARIHFQILAAIVGNSDERNAKARAVE